MERLRLLLKLATLTLAIALLILVAPASAQESDSEEILVETSDQDGSPALTLSTNLLQMRGTIDRGPFEATFYLMSGREPVRNVTMLANDLLSADGKRIPASQYRLSTVTIGEIAADSGALVQVTVPTVALPGTYEGNVDILFAGQRPDQPLRLPLKLIATGLSRLIVADGSSHLTLATERGAGSGWSEPVAFAIKNGGHGQA
jgi:hypothetical protein